MEKKINMTQSRTKKIAYLGTFLVLSLVFSYVESQIPLFIAIPGVKLGIANTVTVIILYMFGLKEAITVGSLRVIISGILFSNLFSIIYGLTGCILSILTMFILKKLNMFSMCGVSFGGAIMHNIGQLIIAACVMEQLSVFYYAPALIIFGGGFGVLTGMLCTIIYKRLETYVRL